MIILNKPLVKHNSYVQQLNQLEYNIPYQSQDLSKQLLQTKSYNHNALATNLIKHNCSLVKPKFMILVLSSFNQIINQSDKGKYSVAKKALNRLISSIQKAKTTTIATIEVKPHLVKLLKTYLQSDISNHSSVSHLAVDMMAILNTDNKNIIALTNDAYQYYYDCFEIWRDA